MGRIPKHPIYLAHKPSKKTSRINGINYRQMVLNHLKTGNAYQVEIIRRNRKYYVHITIEEEIPVPYQTRGAIVLDTNLDGLGVAIVDYLGQYRGSQWLVKPSGHTQAATGEPIQAINPYIDWPSEQTVGIDVKLNHLAATPPGLTVTVQVKLEKVEGRKLMLLCRKKEMYS